MWIVRARRVRAARGRRALGAKGALGISSVICVDGGSVRRTATRAPPAPMFSAVANSRNSLPFSLRLRTKTGMASGSRVHLRRSFSALDRINGLPKQPEALAPSSSHLLCQMQGIVRQILVLDRESPLHSPETSVPARNSVRVRLPGRSLSVLHPTTPDIAKKCKDLPLCGKSGAFFVDKGASTP